MKNLVAVLAITLLSVSMNVNAQEKKPKEKAKKECSPKEMKSCDKDKKAGCCAKMTVKK